MNTYYKVTSKYFDNGKTAAWLEEVQAETMPEDNDISTRICDIYYNYFETREEAEEWIEGVKNA